MKPLLIYLARSASVHHYVGTCQKDMYCCSHLCAHDAYICGCMQVQWAGGHVHCPVVLGWWSGAEVKVCDKQERAGQ